MTLERIEELRRKIDTNPLFAFLVIDGVPVHPNRAEMRELLDLAASALRMREQIQDACAEADVAGYYGENLDGAIQCFRESLAEFGCVRGESEVRDMRMAIMRGESRLVDRAGALLFSEWVLREREEL